LLITSVNPEGPAFRAGIQHGDRILAINKKFIAGNRANAKRAVEQIRGKRGSSVELLVKRDSIRKYFQVKRDRIQVSSIDAAYLIADQQGYIKISKFGAQTDEDFHQSLIKLKKQGMKNLILDLRDNGGGYLSSATALADEFLKDQELIVYTEGLHEPRTDYYASPKGEFEQGKLVVLIDENTASASEIVAGAVQDLERGTIIGRRSFGKGLVQEQFDFGDGSALNLTIARYYTASGRSIQKSYKKGNDAYFSEINNRYKSGELSSEAKEISDSVYKKSKTYTTRSGKILYGGGGIMPDIYIPVDTSTYKELLFTLSGKGVLNDMLYNYLIKTGRKYHNAEELIKSFSLNARDIGMLRKLAASKKIRMKDNQLEDSLPMVKTQLKALMARYYFGDEGFYKALNSGDRAISRSLEVFRAL
ncbi:MAG: S41 family peptidase, partial [Pedobacter sp.]